MPYLELADAKLYYERAGAGAPVVLIQGVGIAGQAWAPQIEALSQRYEVLSFDNRGIGRSSAGKSPLTIERMAQDVLALMDHAGWETAHLIGHSMGGIIAHQAALTAPGRVASLALLCTCARGKDAAKLRWPTLWYGLRMNLGTRAMRRKAALQLVTPQSVCDRLGEEACAAALEQAFGRSLVDQPRHVFQQIRAMGKHDESARLAGLDGIPTLVISAERDEVTPPRFGRPLAASIPGARYVELPGCGHAVTVHDAPKINELLLAHLAQDAFRA